MAKALWSPKESFPMSPKILDTIDRWMLTRLDPGREQSLRTSLEWRARRASVWGSPYQTAAFSDQIGTTSSSAQCLMWIISPHKKCVNHTFIFEKTLLLDDTALVERRTSSWIWSNFPPQSRRGKGRCIMKLKKTRGKSLRISGSRSSRRSDWLAFWEPPCPNCRSFLFV